MIRWMLWGRQYGKTHQTLEWFLGDPAHRVVLAMNEIEAERLRRDLMYRSPMFGHYPFLPLEEWKKLLQKNIVSASKWATERDHTRYTEEDGLFLPRVAIDNLDLILDKLLGAEVALVTATGVNESPKGLRVDPQRIKYDID